MSSSGIRRESGRGSVIPPPAGDGGSEGEEDTGFRLRKTLFSVQGADAAQVMSI